MAYQMNKLCQKLKQCNKILIGAGAGMGKDSGFWNSYPLFRDKFNFYLSANPSFLNSHPHLFWGFYGSRLKMYRQTKPHYGFNLLQKLTQKVTDYFIITSNVDGHFQKIFKKTTKIYQVHGSIHHLQCYSCDQIYQNDFQPIIDLEKMECINLPFCPKCKNIVRPNILMFRDWQWISQRSDAQEKQYAKFLKGIKDDDKIAIIEIGCGTAVPTIRNMCERTFYRYKNSIFIRINEDVSSKFKDPQRFFYIQSGALQALTDLEKKTDNIR